MREAGLALIAAFVGFVLVYGVFALRGGGSLQAAAPVPGIAKTAFADAAQDCVIKGNISIDTGKHIYHLPGQRDYARTIIRAKFGERWFCSEDEARAAGWRKAGN